jgi:hypothetical protein
MTMPEGEFDMDSAVASVASGLGIGASDGAQESVEPQAEVTEPQTDKAPAAESAAKQPDAAPARPAPKSWAKEYHEHWAKLDAKVQDYIEKREKQMLDGLEQYKTDAAFAREIRDVITPYLQHIQAQGIEPKQAIQYLLHAHHLLTTSPAEQKLDYFRKLAASYGIQFDQLSAEAPKEDPALKPITEKLSALEQALRAREQAEYQDRYNKILAEVQAFASDGKHPYFDECYEDIEALVRAGYTLEQAYEKAVYANPVTRAKELARLQAEWDKEMREKAKAEAEKARQAKAANIRSKETTATPTEPLGSMEQTMRETLRRLRGAA